MFFVSVGKLLNVVVLLPRGRYTTIQELQFGDFWIEVGTKWFMIFENGTMLLFSCVEDKAQPYNSSRLVVVELMLEQNGFWFMKKAPCCCSLAL